MAALRAADALSLVPYGAGAGGRARASSELGDFWDVVGVIVDPVGAALSQVGGPVGGVFGFAHGLLTAPGKAAVDFVQDPAGTLDRAIHDVSAEVVDVVHGFEQIGAAVLSVVKSAAPFIQLGLSFIPGIGTAASAALGAAVALAEGRGITDALIAGAKGACPGGPYVATAFEHAVALVGDLAEGQSLADAAGREAIEAGRDEAVNAGGQAAAIAYDTALALAQGKRIQDAGLTAVEAVARGYLPDTPESRAALQVTHGALRGEDTIATLTGAAKDLIPLAPDGVRKTYETADDVWSKANELARAGYAVVHDVGAKILGHAGDVSARIQAGRNIGRGVRQAVSDFEFNANASASFGTGGAADVISQNAPVPAPVQTSTRIAAFSSNPLRISSLSKPVSRYAPVSSGAPPPAQDAGAQLQLSPRTQAFRDSGQSPSEGMTTNTKIAIGVGGLAAVGLVAWLLLK